MLPFLYVALGGAMGAVARYAVSCSWLSWGGGPAWIATLLVNVVGAFLLGLFSGLTFAERAEAPTYWLLLTTGFCGGFTTFSTFSLELATLLQQGKYAPALTYFTAATVLGLLGVMLGLYLARGGAR